MRIAAVVGSASTRPSFCVATGSARHSGSGSGWFWQLVSRERRNRCGPRGDREARGSRVLIRERVGVSSKDALGASAGNFADERDGHATGRYQRHQRHQRHQRRRVSARVRRLAIVVSSAVGTHTGPVRGASPCRAAGTGAAQGSSPHYYHCRCRRNHRLPQHLLLGCCPSLLRPLRERADRRNS